MHNLWTLGFTTIALCAAVAAAPPKPAKTPPKLTTVEAVTTTDGAVFVGSVTPAGAAVLVKTDHPRRDVYLSPSVVASRKKVPAPDAPPEYLFNQEVLTSKKKGAIYPVVDQGAWGAWQPDGSTTFSGVDPNLGKFTVTMVITRVTPTQVELTGVEYTKRLVFPAIGLAQFVREKVLATVKADDAEAALKAAIFLRQFGDIATAERLLTAAAGAPFAPDGIAAERRRVAAEGFRRTLIDARRLVAFGLWPEAWTLMGQLSPSADVAAALPEESAEAKRLVELLTTRRGDHESAVALLTKHGHEGDKLSAAQGHRIARLLKLGTPNAVAVNDRLAKHLPLLAAPWADALADAPMGLTPETLEAAGELATATANFFAQESPDGLEGLALQYEKSTLPPSLKLAIFRRAVKLPETVAQPQNWEKVTFKVAAAGEEFHYHIQLPPGYRADEARPALVAMHGQTSDSSVMNRVWGEWAARYRIILISPEYIYGRRWGYRYSESEHSAVMGALRHAAMRYNIDPERVFLTGQSQGGHASWDIGPAHAGVFAGVIPIIGANFNGNRHLGLTDTAVYAIGGSDDGRAPSFNRQALQDLSRLKSDARFVEYVGRGHEGFSEEYAAVMDWLAVHRRAAPKSARIVALRPSDCRRRWLEIAEPGQPLPDSNGRGTPFVTLSGDIQTNNRVALSANQVRRLRVFLPAEEIDFAKPVQVTVNGRPMHKGDVKPDWRFALRDSFLRRDRSDVFFGVIDISAP